MYLIRNFVIAVSWLFLSVSMANADEQSTQTKAKQIWQLLDYLAVDYRKAVKDGTVSSAAEYAEMQEFATAAERQLGELAPPPSQDLVANAHKLRLAIDQKASAEVVSAQARALERLTKPSSCSTVNSRVH